MKNNQPTLAAIFLFLFSLAFPALKICANIGDSYQWVYGFSILLWGWLGIIDGQIGWFCNILFAVNAFFLISNKRPIRALIFTQLILTAWACLPISVAIDERGAGKICGHGLGFFLWIISNIIIISISFSNINCDD